MIFSLYISFLVLLFKSIYADTECPYVTLNEDRRKDKTKLRIVQYNAEWLFIDYYNGSNCPGNGCPWKNVTEATIHMDYVANVLKELDPDIINFCEVEGCDELNLVNNLLDRSYMPYLKKGTDTSTGQNVGMLTRIDPIISLYRTENRYDYPISGSKCGYNGVGSSGVSKHYITSFEFNNIRTALISAHLIAIPTDPARCAQREAQAMVLQGIIQDYINKDYEVIVLGDFNDYDSEVLDLNNDIPKSRVLDILKGYNSTNSYVLENIADTIIHEERYSDWYDSDNNCNTASIKDYSMIDHILVSDGIKKYISDTFIYHGYSIYCGTYNSDHYPVVIDFLF
jgi:exonuclease III